MLSLDFLAGFTIFLLALIMVVSMVPGLLAGLQSSGIDYDAVAYRTGVILVEDPGWWEDRRPLPKSGRSWELEDKDNIKRMGLAVSKDTPNILLSTKVERFFKKLPSGEPFFTADDYRSKVIFGDIPYSYNISLWSLDGTYKKSTGDPLPPGYGYIRRVVKIKEPSVAEIVGNTTSPSESPYWTSTPTMPTQAFTVHLNFSQLQSQATNKAHQIDPTAEPVNVTITNFGAYRNSTGGDAILRHVGFQGTDPFDIPFRYETIDPDLYTLQINGAPHNLTPGAQVTKNVSLVLKPAITSSFPPDRNNILNIRFTFENTNITGTHPYDYVNTTRPDLKTGVLEVAIW